MQFSVSVYLPLQVNILCITSISFNCSFGITTKVTNHSQGTVGCVTKDLSSIYLNLISIQCVYQRIWQKLKK